MDKKTWHISFEFDPAMWAIPLFFRWYFWESFEITFLCFSLDFAYYCEKELTPEEELEGWKEWSKDTLQFMSEERERIDKRFGVTTSA